MRTWNRMFLGFLLLGVGASGAIAPGGVFYPDGATTLHFAFEGSPNGDRPIVRPPAFYHADDGFGFVDSPGLIGTSRGVTAPRYFRFDVNLPEGNYDVAVTMGGVREESVTTIKAEGHRPVVLDAQVSPGQTATRTFTVNVRHGETTALDADGRLTLEFAGTNPSLMKLDIRPNTQAATIFIAGDLAAADREPSGGVEERAGWGQMLPVLFKPGEVAVANWAEAGEGGGAQGFIARKRLEAMARTMREGDCLLIEFGGAVGREAARGEEKAALQGLIEEARKHKATPVLVTPPPRAGQEAEGGMWGMQVMRDLAQEQKVALIDLNTAGSRFLMAVGPGSAGAVSGSGKEGQLTPYGAYEMAKLVAQGLREQKLELAGHLAGESMTNADPSKFPANLGYAYLKKP